jgi:hypothetical protein
VRRWCRMLAAALGVIMLAIIGLVLAKPMAGSLS